MIFRSIPYTLDFCRKLKEIYLDNNLLDALPSVLLSMTSLKTVHRHGNHNYFKYETKSALKDIRKVVSTDLFDSQIVRFSTSEYIRWIY